nr:MAG TPA: hypothetical protein [Caudoviricetes sp.]
MRYSSSSSTNLAHWPGVINNGHTTGKVISSSLKGCARTDDDRCAKVRTEELGVIFPLW